MRLFVTRPFGTTDRMGARTCHRVTAQTRNEGLFLSTAFRLRVAVWVL